MKIQTEIWGDEEPVDVTDYVRCGLMQEAEDYTDTAWENAYAAQAALSRLCGLLAERGILSAQDIVFITHGEKHDATFVKD